MKLVTVQNLRDLIAHHGVELLLRQMADYIREDFRRWPAFEKAPRYASHGPEGVIELMPTSDGEAFAFKYVNGHPRNHLRGRQTVAAFGVLSEVATGYPQLIAEMTVTTALRTAAMSAVAARELARPDARVMAVIGLGAQSEFQALAFQVVNGVRRLRVFDPDAAAVAKFVANLATHDLEITVARTVEAAVSGADIVTTVTADKRRASVLSDNLVGAGVHINAVGGDCPGKTELQSDILRRASVFVEFEPQTRTEGEIQQMAADFPVTELWRVITGDAAGRRSRDEITIFDSVGFAIEDFSALRLLRDLVEGTSFCSHIDLIPDLADPKDLFGALSAPPAPAGPRLPAVAA